MKGRYLVFQYDYYYPAGGINDLKGIFDTIEDVKEFLQKDQSGYENYDVYDRINNIKITVYVD